MAGVAGVVGVAETLHLLVVEDETRRAVAVHGQDRTVAAQDRTVAAQGGDGRPPAQLVSPLRVVIDLALPGLSGVELLVHLRRIDDDATRKAGDAPAPTQARVLTPGRLPDWPRRPEVNVVVTEDRDREGSDDARSGRAGMADRWSSLTSAEVEVAVLAAAGLTNRQISEQLFTSPRTTETHLAHVYKKLGVSGRTQLAAETARRAH